MNNHWRIRGMMIIGLLLIVLSPSVAIPARQSGSGATTNAELLNDGQMHVVLLKSSSAASFSISMTSWFGDA